MKQELATTAALSAHLQRSRQPNRDEQHQQPPAAPPKQQTAVSTGPSSSHTPTSRAAPQGSELEHEVQQLLGVDAATLSSMGLSVQHMAQLYSNLREQASARRPAAEQQMPGPAERMMAASDPAYTPGRSALAAAVDYLHMPEPAWQELAEPEAQARGSSVYSYKTPTPLSSSPPPGRSSPPAATAASRTRVYTPVDDGPTRDELKHMLADYETAFESVKERLEVELKHEQMRANHLQKRVAERDKQLVTAQEDVRLAKENLASSQEQQKAGNAALAACQQQLSQQQGMVAQLQEMLGLTKREMSEKLNIAEDNAARKVAELQQQVERGNMAMEQLTLLREQHEQLRLAGLAEVAARSQLADELAHAKADMQAAVSSEERWRGMLDGARSRAEHAEDLARGSEQELSDVRSDLAELQRQHNSTLDVLGATQHELERTRMAALEARAEAVALITAMNQQLTSTRSELRDQQFRFAEARDLADFKVLEAHSMAKQLQAAKDHVADLGQQLKQTCTELEMAQHARQDAVEATLAAETKRDMTEAKLMRTQEDLAHSKDENALLNTQVSELTRSLQSTAEQLASTQSNLTELMEAHKQLETHREELAAAGQKNEEVMAAQDQQLKELQQLSEEQAESLDRLKEQYTALVVKAEKLPELYKTEQEHKALLVRMQQMTEGVAKLQQELSAEAAAHNDAILQMNACRSELSKALEDLGFCQMALTAAELKLSEQKAKAEQQIGQLREDLSAREKDSLRLATDRDAWCSCFHVVLGQLQEVMTAAGAQQSLLLERAADLGLATHSMVNHLVARPTTSRPPSASSGTTSSKRPRSPTSQTPSTHSPFSTQSPVISPRVYTLPLAVPPAAGWSSGESSQRTRPQSPHSPLSPHSLPSPHGASKLARLISTADNNSSLNSKREVMSPRMQALHAQLQSQAMRRTSMAVPAEALHAGHDMHKQMSTILGFLSNQADAWREQAVGRLKRIREGIQRAGKKASEAWATAMDVDSIMPTEATDAAMEAATTALSSALEALSKGRTDKINLPRPSQIIPSLAISSKPPPKSMGGVRLSGLVPVEHLEEQQADLTALRIEVGNLQALLLDARSEAEAASRLLQEQQQEAAARELSFQQAIDLLQLELEALGNTNVLASLLRERYVADLLARLREAEWKVAIARRREATWGFKYMVPIGRCDRAIQTLYTEVWAQDQAAGADAKASSKKAAANKRNKVAADASTQAAADAAGAEHLPEVHAPISHKQLVQLYSTVPPLEARAGMEPAASLSAQVPGMLGQRSSKTSKTALTEGARAVAAAAAAKAQAGGQQGGGRADGATPGADALPNTQRWQDTAVEYALDNAVEVMGLQQLLQLISSIYSAKVDVDMTAAQQQQPLASLDAYVPAYFARQFAASTTSLPQQQQQLSVALAQLVASLMTHAPHSKEVATFGVLCGCIPESLSQMASAASARCSMASQNSQRSQLAADAATAPAGAQPGLAAEESTTSAAALTATGAGADAEPPEAVCSHHADQQHHHPPEESQQQQQQEQKPPDIIPDSSAKLVAPINDTSRVASPDMVSFTRAWSITPESPPSLTGRWAPGSKLRRASSSQGRAGSSWPPLRPKMQPEQVPPGHMMHPLCDMVLQELMQLPGGSALLQLVASGAAIEHLQEHDLGVPLTEEQSPHAHLLLLEAADILGVHPLPALYCREDSLPFLHLLHLPAAWKGRPSSGDAARNKGLGGAAAAADGSVTVSRATGKGGKAGGKGQQKKQSSSSSSGSQTVSKSSDSGPMHTPYSWRRKAVLVLSSALLQQVQNEPQQLQLLLAAAMGPLCTYGGMGWDPSAPSPPSCSSTADRVALADVLSATALVQLAPSAILAALPSQVVALLPGLAPSLQVVAHMAMLCADRAMQLVAQSEQRQQELQVHMHVMAEAAGVFGCTAAGIAAGSNLDAAAAGVHSWLERVLESKGSSTVELDDVTQELAQQVTAAVYDGQQVASSSALDDGSSCGSSMARLCALEVQRWLVSMSGYPAIMANCKPLRRVLPPALQRQVQTNS